MTERARAGLRLDALRPLFVCLVLAGPLALGIGRALPAEGAGLGLRLAAATVCVALLPGALVLRAFDWPRRAGIALAGSLAWSLVVCFVALLLVFAANASLSLAVAVLGIVSGGALVAALRARPAGVARRDLVPLGAILALGLVLTGVVWWSSTSITGDALFHLGRVRKLDELDALGSPSTLNELSGGSLHPGYAFPLWHSVLALVARFAGVDSTLVLAHESALLVPLALALAYAAGAALFGNRYGGVATAVAQAALIGFQRNGTGSFGLTALPSSSARLLLLPALAALVFAYVRSRRRIELATIGAAGLGLAVVHPTYAVFVLVPLAGFLVVRALLADRESRDWREIALALVAIVVPTALFFAWLFPVVSDAAAILPGGSERARATAAYGMQLDMHGRLFNLSAGSIARGGAATAAALLAVPAAALAARRRPAAFVLGGTLAVLLVLLVPPFFTALADVTSLSQARRLVLFLPLAFALAAGCAALGRLRLAGVALAAAAGVGFVLAYPGSEETGRLAPGGPAWTTWLALGGGFAALAAARLLRPEGPRPTAWAAAAVVALALPIAVHGFLHVEQSPPDRRALTPGLVQALNTLVPPRETVFSDLETSYRIVAYAPLTVAAAPPAHVANSGTNRPYERRRDVIRFFSRDDVSYLEKAGILASYGASWLVVDKTRKVPDYVRFLDPPVYEDGRFALYSLRHDAASGGSS